jgi:hypothetical protein
MVGRPIILSTYDFVARWPFPLATKGPPLRVADKS